MEGFDTITLPLGVRDIHEDIQAVVRKSGRLLDVCNCNNPERNRS